MMEAMKFKQCMVPVRSAITVNLSQLCLLLLLWCWPCSSSWLDVEEKVLQGEKELWRLPHFKSFLCLSYIDFDCFHSFRFLPSPWRIVVPALILNILTLGFVISATTILHNGLQRFCDQLLGKKLDMSGTGINGTATDIEINPEHGFRTLTG